MAIKFGFNGLGRIGRMVIRAIIESKNQNIVIKHINNRSNSEVSYSLLKHDSIHGKFNANLSFDENHFTDQIKKNEEKTQSNCPISYFITLCLVFSLALFGTWMWKPSTDCNP